MVDDYGHHPTEVAATLQAARNSWPGRRLVVVFQPHRYSRTQDLFDDFTAVLADVDVLLVSEVYAAGEQPVSGADARSLCAAIRQRGKVNPIFVEEIDEVDRELASLLKDGDVLLTLGAGSIGRVASGLPQKLREAA
jgi:UDP-N-acetylmuramate--alanine ligase